jgi:hypothetical protein
LWVKKCAFERCQNEEEKEGFLEVGFWGRVGIFLAMTREDVWVQIMISNAKINVACDFNKVKLFLGWLRSRILKLISAVLLTTRIIKRNALC